MKFKQTVLMPLLCALTAVSVWGQPAERRPMTVDDALKMADVGDALISPDGEWVFFSKRELDWDKNKFKKKYFRVSSRGGEAYQYLGEDGGKDFQFSPKGTYFSFLRSLGGEKDRESGDSGDSGDSGKESQVFIMRATGGEAVQITKHKGGIQAFKWSPDEKRLFFVADEARSEKEQKEYKKGEDVIFVDEGPNGQGEARWRRLWMFEIEDKSETLLTEGDFRISDFEAAPEGDRVLFIARRENRRNQGYLAEIFLVNAAEKSLTRLSENNAPEDKPRWAPDGRAFAFTAPDDREWELRNDKIWLMDLESRKSKMISGRFEGNIGDFHWAPDGSILFSGLQRTDSNLYRLDPATGEVEQLTRFKGQMRVADFSADRTRYVYEFNDHDTPSDLFAGSLGEGDDVRLTDANPWIEKELALAEMKTIRWQSRDGLEIEGLLYLPADYRQGMRLPLILNIHGGPAGVFSNRFSPSYHIYAGLGYISLAPNVRGSSGYSDELLRGNMRDIGGGDYQDLMSGVDFVIEQGFVDAERMGLKGWSYGGILGGWTITQTDRFKAASLGAMVADWTSEYGPGFNFDVRLWYIGGTPWENPEGYRSMSSLTHIANVKTPTILFHGMRDLTDTEPQSMMFYAALKDRGVDVRYIRFPREPHGLREPRHQRVRDIEEIKWMQKYVLGLEWAPWERPTEEKDQDAKEVETSGGRRGRQHVH